MDELSTATTRQPETKVYSTFLEESEQLATKANKRYTRKMHKQGQIQQELVQQRITEKKKLKNLRKKSTTTV